jgi:hypothetical protein
MTACCVPALEMARQPDKVSNAVADARTRQIDTGSENMVRNGEKPVG